MEVLTRYEDIRIKAISALEKVGAYIQGIDADIEDDINLHNYILDSLQYITFIVELEQTLDIEIPDDMLNYENLLSLNAFCIGLSELYDIQ